MASDIGSLSNIGVTITLLLGLIGFFRNIEESKDGAFREIATRLCDETSPVVRAAAAGQLADYFRYRRHYFGIRPYASQVLHLLLLSLKHEDDLDVRQVIFNGLVTITANANLKTVAEAAGASLGRGVNLNRAKLNNIIMDEFDFTGISMIGVAINESSSQKAKFVGANLWRARISHSDLVGADFTEAKLWDGTFDNVDFTNANLLTNHVTDETLFRECAMKNAKLSDAMQSRVATGGNVL